MNKNSLLLTSTVVALDLFLGSHFLSGIGGATAVPANKTVTPVGPVANACPRAAAGSTVENPPALFSRGGVLKVSFSYQTRVDADGRNLFCFMTPDGLENPTLHVHPGDHLVIKVTNNTPAAPVVMQINSPNCGASDLTGSSVNMHFHGTNTSPTCHQDEVIHTLINSGETFAYDVRFPANEPPGLYWYHPHAHMLVEAALQGGASGAIIVDGIQNFQHAVAGLQQQVIVIRDQNVAGNPTPGGDVPSWDLTLNNVPIAYPDETPAVIQMQPGQKQLWRVSNSSADSILDLQVLFDGVAQNLQIVALDGVPTGSQNHSRRGTIVNATDIQIPTAGRAEFIVTAPPSAVTDASLVTLAVNTGPDGDNDPQRTLATLKLASGHLAAVENVESRIATTTAPPWKQRFEGLATAKPVTARTLYFSENNPLSQFFITAGDATPTLFDPNEPPAIIATQGSVEDWTIQNQTLENHEFHMHQLHFLVESQDNFVINGNVPDAAIQKQLVDTIQIPFWDGNPNHPFPSVSIRVDFRGPDVGDFVYHCHIAEHEDDGMMAVIRVLPASRVAATIERIRLYLAYANWAIRERSSQQRAAAWCVRGRVIETKKPGPARGLVKLSQNLVQ